MDVTLPNGVVVKDVPEGTDKWEIAKKAVAAGLAKTEDFYQLKGKGPDADPLAGMSGGKKFLAGVGKGMTDLAYGAGQALGLVDQETVQAKAERDAPLMESGLGQAGSLTGQIATAAPLMFVPGANTAMGAALTGVGLGLAEPIPEGDVLEGKLFSAAAGAAGGRAGHYVGKKVGEKLASNAAQRSVQQSQNATRDATLKAGQSAGYVVEPTLANPTTTNRMLEGVAGKLSTAQRAAEHNQAITNTLARKSIGLAEDQPIDAAALKGVRDQAGQVYEYIRTLPIRVNSDARFQSSLESIVAPFRKLAEDVPEEAGDKIEKLIQQYSKESFDPSNVVTLIQRRRKEATTLFKSFDDPVKRDLAKAHRAIADALEDLLERNVDDPNLLSAFRQARELIAKTHTVEAALNEGSGNVVAAKLAQQLTKGKPLSGDLMIAARFARAFPKATQEIKSSMPGISPLDVYAGGGVAALTGDPTALAAIGLRPAVRNVLTSRMYQNRMTQPGYQPGAMEKLSPIVRNRLAPVAAAAGSVNAVQQ